MSPVSSTAGSFVRSGKVRDLYAIGEDRLLLVASDRLSAFDVVLPTEIPDKGRVLTGLSRFWFSRTESIVPNHLLAAAPEDLPAEMAWDQDASRELRGRMMLCRRADVLPIEVIVRGYITGSGWKDYPGRGPSAGSRSRRACKESERLPEPLFTPSTKAEVGPRREHRPCRGRAARRRGHGAARSATSRSSCTSSGRRSRSRPGSSSPTRSSSSGSTARPASCCSIDEVLTPDSSRFWDASAYEPGRAQASFDKQFVRDWLETQAWDKTPPGPELPSDIVDGTRARYVEAFERITGASFDDYLARRLGEVLSVDMRFAVNVAPKDGILDPQGRAVEGSLGPPRDRGRVGGPRRAAGRADRDRRRRGRRARRRRAARARAALEPADRALRGRGAGRGVVARGWRRVTIRIGVVVFPGSNRDIDAFNGLARRRRESRSSCGTSRPRSTASPRS